MEEVTLEEVLERVGDIIGSQKDTDIAESLLAGRSTLSTWRKREHIPYKNIIEFCLNRNIPIESVLIGKVRKGEHIYGSPEQALSVVLEVQSELKLVLSADQLKSLLGYAYTSQSGKQELIEFVQAAFEIANKKIPTSVDATDVHI